MSFVYAGIVHLLVMAFGGNGYSETYRAYAYAMIPATILMLIPVVGFLGFIYAIILMVIGLSRLHNITIGKATIAVLAPILLIIGLAVTFVLYLLSNIRF